MSGDSALQREIQQRVPFSSPEEEAVLAILKTADVVRVRIAKVVERFSVTPQQYNVLRILRGAGPGGIPTLDIVERMIERAPGITRMIDRLERQGLVDRERGSDRRQVLCRITDRGGQLLATMDQPVAEAGAATIGALAAADIGALLSLLDRVRAG